MRELLISPRSPGVQVYYASEHGADGDKSLFSSLEIVAEKAVATHSSTLAWKIPWMEDPGRLQSMGSPRVGYN